MVVVNQDSLIGNNTKSCGHCNDNTYEQYDENTMQINAYGKQILIDKEDYERVKTHQWYIGKNGYPVTNVNRTPITLHRYLIDTDKETIDHINGNPLDNRKTNLRPATHRENSYNAKVSKNNKSGYKGVWWSRDKRKYCAEIHINRKKIHLGYFTKPEEAAKAYDKAAVQYFGSFAKTNFAMT